MMEEICLEILEMLKECLWHRWGPVLPDEKWRQAPTSIRTTRTPAQAEFHAQMQATYQNMWQESCEKALVRAQDAHCQVLTAAAMLEGHIERLSCSISSGWPSSQEQWYSWQCSHSRRWTRSCRSCLPASQKEQVPSAVVTLGTL